MRANRHYRDPYTGRPAPAFHRPSAKYSKRYEHELRELGLRAPTIRVAVAVVDLADREHGITLATYAYIAQHVAQLNNCCAPSRDSVKRAVHELEQIGAVTLLEMPRPRSIPGRQRRIYLTVIREFTRSRKAAPAFVPKRGKVRAARPARPCTWRAWSNMAQRIVEAPAELAGMALELRFNNDKPSCIAHPERIRARVAGGPGVRWRTMDPEQDVESPRVVTSPKPPKITEETRHVGALAASNSAPPKPINRECDAPAFSPGHLADSAMSAEGLNEGSPPLRTSAADVPGTSAPVPPPAVVQRQHPAAAKPRGSEGLVIDSDSVSVPSGKVDWSRVTATDEPLRAMFGKCVSGKARPILRDFLAGFPTPAAAFEWVERVAFYAEFEEARKPIAYLMHFVSRASANPKYRNWRCVLTDEAVREFERVKRERPSPQSETMQATAAHVEKLAATVAFAVDLEGAPNKAERVEVAHAEIAKLLEAQQCVREYRVQLFELTPARRRREVAALLCVPVPSTLEACRAESFRLSRAIVELQRIA